MLGISFYELLVIAVVMVLFMRSKDLVPIIFFIKKIFSSLRSYYLKIENEFEKLMVLGDFDEMVVVEKKDVNKVNPIDTNEIYTK